MDVKSMTTKALLERKQKLELILKPEEEGDWIRIPVAECQVTATIDISKKEGIKALYCGKEKKVRTYMFDKRDPYNWTMAKAKKWVEDHKSWAAEVGERHQQEDELAGGISIEPEPPKRREYSQSEIADELDYVYAMVLQCGMNDHCQKVAWQITREVMRLTGDDIPDDILAKVGAVLSQKNKGDLTKAQALIQVVLDSAKPEQESLVEAIKLQPDELKEVVARSIKVRLEQIQG